MKIRTTAAVLLTVVPMLAACSASDTTSATSSTAATTAGTNSRGAIEVDLGQPVTVTDSAGNLVLNVTGTRLDTSGCAPATGEVTQAKFVATIKTGNVETDQWLWESDFYYVDPTGKVVENIDVTQKADLWFPCTESVLLIKTPPNSIADGSPTLAIPNNSTTIGYHLEAGGVDQRVEWKLPGGLSAAVQSTAAETAESETTTQEQPATTTASETTYPTGTVPGEGADLNSGIPSEWDRDGNGLIDTDAPVGDGDCDNPQCLLGPNG